MTALGTLRFGRQYTTTADGGHFLADDTLGIDGYVSPAAERMAVFAGTRDSFAHAQHTLRELCGWHLDDEVIRQLTHAAARRATAHRETRTDDERMARAPGDLEVAIDAGKVNTDTGWRDVKLAVFCRRKAGPPVGLDQWKDRTLPTPSVRAVVAAIEEASAFAGRVRAESDRLNVTTAADLTVLGDGAEWIWNLSAAVVPQAAGVLDAFHAIAHVADAVKAIGTEPSAAAERIATGRRALLGQGKVGIETWIADRFGELPAGADGEPLIGLAAYLLPHATRLEYASRLARGRSIGSGLVEGSITQFVNRRLKQTGAKWKVAHVGPLVELAALIDTPDWNTLWVAA
ncbi:ISKra4 family transposase [Fimbriiglobus ruber]|uniref:ISKra4 family transposase n=1 Tax=Fimbriiglobus ruber TaxID=1908690 RepID=A0A225DNF7_9BACT|nr:ISKra4 family transposase [Fimbriiglobus ruber]OWK41234.1 hypothetical protein FRUB_04597 [Fimbriiglobus ruber]